MDFKEINLNVLILFLVLSLGLSYFLRFYAQRFFLEFNIYNDGSLVLSGFLSALTLAIPGLIARKTLQKKSIHLLGKNPLLAIYIIVIPPILLCIMGLENSSNIQVNLFGLIMGGLYMFFGVLKEIAWRGYLQIALEKSVNKYLTYFIVGLIWYFWHWYFTGGTNSYFLILIPILSAASFGLAEVARSTKSLFACGAIHGLADIILMHIIFSYELSNLEGLIMILVCFAIWIPLMKKIELS